MSPPCRLRSAGWRRDSMSPYHSRHGHYHVLDADDWLRDARRQARPRFGALQVFRAAVAVFGLAQVLVTFSPTARHSVRARHRGAQPARPAQEQQAMIPGLTGLGISFHSRGASGALIASARAGNRIAATKACPANGTGRPRLPFGRRTYARCFPCVRGAIQGRGQLAAGP